MKYFTKQHKRHVYHTLAKQCSSKYLNSSKFSSELDTMRKKAIYIPELLESLHPNR